MITRILVTFLAFFSIASHASLPDAKMLAERGDIVRLDFGYLPARARPGDNPIKIGWSTPHKGFEALGWDVDDFCDAFRAHPDNVAASGGTFTDADGCDDNPGFRNLKEGAIWQMPTLVPSVSKRSCGNAHPHKVAVLNEGFTGIVCATTEVMRSYLSARIEQSFNTPEEAALHHVDRAHALFQESDSGKTVTVTTEAQRALDSRPEPAETPTEVSVSPELQESINDVLSEYTTRTEEELSWYRTLNFILIGALVVLAVLAGAFFARMQATQRRMDAQTVMYTRKRQELDERERGLEVAEKAMRNTHVPLVLPDDLNRFGEPNTRPLPVKRWLGEMGASDAEICLAGAHSIRMAYQSGHHDWRQKWNPKNVLKHLNSDTDMAAASRRQLGIDD